MIRFTKDGIFADTQKERDEFYLRMDNGDPTIMAHLELWREELSIEKETEDDLPTTQE